MNHVWPPKGVIPTQQAFVQYRSFMFCVMLIRMVAYCTFCLILNKNDARQYTRAVLSIFAEIRSSHPISAYIFLLSPTLGLPLRSIDALFGVTGISG